MLPTWQNMLEAMECLIRTERKHCHDLHVLQRGSTYAPEAHQADPDHLRLLAHAPAPH